MSPSEAESHKLQGNVYFGQQLYDEAIREYSTAIIKYPSNPVYYTNRALCYLRTAQYDRVIGDCEKATELDGKWVKGYYLMGQALTENDHRLDRAITILRKAYDLALQQRVSYIEEIANAFRRAKKKRWEVADHKRRQSQSELYRYLMKLMEEERGRRVSGVEEGEREEVERELDRRKDEIQAVFDQAEIESARRREVPDYYCGKISFEIMMDPVVTPSGITYDRAEIRQHLNKIGQFDPLTRKPMTESDLIPNLAMKEAIDDYLDK
ncbi:STIP1 y and U box-containing protein 1 [Rhizophlyctis rosea]|nr:STIP1 y and U box-containing protein 1 [Rhizophlyctis rosea]